MSYDLTIRSDEKYSSYLPYDQVCSAIAGQPNISGSGPGFTFSRSRSYHMEIDCENVSVEGDIGQSPKYSGKVNCISLHIPYSFFGKRPETYLAFALTIANALQWQVYDNQIGKLVTAIKIYRPWWRFWASS